MKELKALVVIITIAMTLVIAAVKADTQNMRIVAVLDASGESLPLQGTFNELYIEGTWLEEKMAQADSSEVLGFLQAVVSSGVPTAISGGNIDFSDVITNLTMRYDLGRAVDAQAIKVHPELTSNGRMLCDQLFVIGVNVTQEEIMENVHSWTLSKNDAVYPLAMDRQASESVTSDIEATLNQPETLSGGYDPYWDLLSAYTILYLANPVGNLNITHCWYGLYNDGSNTYNWLNLVTEITSIPGRIAYGSDWRTADIWNSIDIDYYGDPNPLIDYGPADTSGQSTVTYNIGVQSGQQGAKVTSEMSVSYSAVDVNIDEQSDSSQMLAKWYHDVPEDKTNGMNAYTIKPGATLRYQPIAPFSIYTWHQAKYGKPVWWIIWDWWTTDEIPLRIDWLGRDLNIFIVKTTDSQSWYVSNTNDVESGVLEAANDAYANSLVKFANEAINVYEITSSEDLFALALNPPLRAVFVNTHGEVIPTPSWYFGPSVQITYPSDGSTVNYQPTINAQVYPPPGRSLQLCHPEGYTQWSYVWTMWYRPSTGALGWTPMYPNSSSGGYYYRTLSLPAYDSYQVYVLAISNYLESVAHITVNYVYSPPPPGGGCPYVYTYNGSGFSFDNNLLMEAAHSDGMDVVDYYRLQQPLVPNDDNTYTLRVSEFETEHDFLDKVKLLVVDHSPNVNIGVSPEGEILTYRKPIPAMFATDDNGNDVRRLINTVDQRYYQGQNGSYVVLNFGKLGIIGNSKLVLRTDMYYKVSIHVEVQDAQGNWNEVASFIPRHNWSTEVIDISSMLADIPDELLVRLYFTGNHKLDFAGLDITEQEELAIQECELISSKKTAGMELNGLGELSSATLEQLIESDDSYAELTPGHTIEMDFSVPERHGILRDYVFLIEGYYEKAGSPYACNVAWEEWFELLGSLTRDYGWIWANVAGYSCYYVGSTWYNSKIPDAYREKPGEQGMKTFLGMDVTCSYSEGHQAKLDVHFIDRAGFHPAFYNDLPTGNIAASRPLATTNLPFNTIGYTDTATGQRVTASITMNSTIDGITSGIFIHSGFDAGASDWVKGYVAGMLSIEEARAFIMTPKTFARMDGNLHTTVFSVTMLPGGWGTGTANFPDVGSRDYRYVDLLLTISTHFEDYYYTTSWFDGWNWHIDTHVRTLDEVDYKFTSVGIDTESWAQIHLEDSGWETGGVDTTLFNRLGWWFAGLAAATLGMGLGIPYLGSAVGLIPILIGSPNTPEQHVGLDTTVWANRTGSDPNDDDWGTTTFYFRIVFRKGSLPRNYDFQLGMTSWLGEWFFPSGGLPYYSARLSKTAFTTSPNILEFTVTG